MRRTLLLTGLVALPLALAAQSGAPATPTSCMQDVSTWYSSATKAAQDSARLPGGKAPDYSALFSTRTTKLKECAARFSVERTSGAELIVLAGLDSQAGLDSLATVAVNRRLAEPGLSEPDRAAALVAMIHALTRPDTLLIVRAEPYMKQLDAMSDAVIMDKLSAHSNLNGEYRYLDVNDRIRQHSLAIIALGRKLKAASAGDRSPGAVSAFTLLGAYANLGEVYADLGQVDSTFRILDQAVADHPEISAKDADAYLKPERERYELVGKPAMAAGGRALAERVGGNPDSGSQGEGDRDRVYRSLVHSLSQQLSGHDGDGRDARQAGRTIRLCHRVLWLHWREEEPGCRCGVRGGPGVLRRRARHSLSRGDCRPAANAQARRTVSYPNPTPAATGSVAFPRR